MYHSPVSIAQWARTGHTLPLEIPKEQRIKLILLFMLQSVRVTIDCLAQGGCQI